MGLFLSILYIIIVSILSNLIFELLPRRLFSPLRFPFRQWRLERSGKLYRRLRVQLWKDKLPDRTRKRSTQPYSAADAWNAAIEGCVAELMRALLLLSSFVLYLINESVVGALIAILYALSQLLFLIAQRYNRPGLLRLSRAQAPGTRARGTSAHHSKIR